MKDTKYIAKLQKQFEGRYMGDRAIALYQQLEGDYSKWTMGRWEEYDAIHLNKEDEDTYLVFTDEEADEAWHDVWAKLVEKGLQTAEEWIKQVIDKEDKLT